MTSSLSHSITCQRVILSLPSEANPNQQQTQQQTQQWRKQTQQVFSHISLHTALPPQAILIIRHLDDPNPQQLLSKQTQKQWENAAQNAINNCWRTAARPIHQTVSAQANSVWFTDPAEWLICLSLDLFQGTATQHWWWHSALSPYSHQSLTDTLTHLWQRHNQALPAAITHLSHHHPTQTAATLNQFTTSQIHTLFHPIIQQHNLNNTLKPLTETPHTQSPQTQQIITQLTAYLSPACQQWIQTLPPLTKAFVATCLTLPNTEIFLQQSAPTPQHHNNSPTETSAPPLNSNTTNQNIQSKKNSNLFSKTESSLTQPDKKRNNTPKIVGIQSTPLTPTPKNSQASNQTSNQTSNQASNSNTPNAKEPNNNALNSETSQFNASNHHTAPTAQQRPTPHHNSATQSANFTSSTSHQPAEQGLITEIGGLWYLINILTALNWPAKEILPPWQQVFAIAQYFLPHHPNDPVWALINSTINSSLTNPHPTTTQQQTHQWQTQTLPAIQTYLQTNLEHPHRITEYLLEPAMLYFTRTHIDIIFSLEQINLDLRIAGLDQDPGWIAPLGRVISFHYE